MGAARLVREGADVILADIDEERGAAVAAEMGGTFFATDVTEASGANHLIDFANERDGGLGILVNNAGGYNRPVFPDAAAAHWERVLDLNLRAVMLCTQAALPAMARRGVVVNIASAAGTGTRPYDGAPEYAAAKAAVIRLTAAMRERDGVRINCISPDWVGTAAVRESIAAMTDTEREDVPDVLIEPDVIADGVIRFVRDDTLAGRIMVIWCGERSRLLPDNRRD